MLEEMKEQSRQSVCPYWVGHYHFCMTNRQETIPQRHGQETQLEGQRAGPGARGEAGGWDSWLCTRWHGRCKYSSSWKSASLGVYRVLRVGVFCWSLSSLCWVPWPEKLAWAAPPTPQQLPPWATRRWRSTVCSASILRRKWGGAAGSRGGPGPVRGQGRLSRAPWPLGPPPTGRELAVPGMGSPLCHPLPALRPSQAALPPPSTPGSLGVCASEHQ